MLSRPPISPIRRRYLELLEAAKNLGMKPTDAMFYAAESLQRELLEKAK